MTCHPPAESSWWPLCHTKLRGDRWTPTREPNTSRVVWWVCGGGELWGRPERRTDRGKRYIFVSFCISRLTLQNGSSHSTLPKLMRCFAKLKDSWRLHLSLSCHGLFFRSYFCRYDIPFTHSWSVPFPPFLSVTTGCWLVSLFCSLCFTFHSFLSLTPQDVITPTDV